MKYLSRPFSLVILFLAFYLTPLFLRGQKTNIILIMADDLGLEMLGCYGNTEQLTPNLDRLASTGMQFENCFSTPLCTPSRVQLMTGKYNHRNYIGFGLLDPKEITFAHMLKQAGYKTGITGKWQLLGNARQRQLAGGKTGSLPHQAGFDEYCLWQVDTLGSRYKNPVVYTNKLNSSVLLENEYGPDVFNRFALDFIETHRNEPFFLYYPMCLTHAPFEPTPISSAYETGKEDPKYFRDMVKYMDHLVGNVIDKLTEQGLLENTLLIFIGDNGTDRTISFEVNGVQRKGEKGSSKKGGIHVPMIVSWEKHIKPGSKTSALIDFTDFVPTFLEVADAKTSVKLDGFSFLPILTGQKSNVRDWVFCHYDPNWGNFTPKTFAFDERWKVYSSGEIYDIKTDPDEKKSLDPTTLKASDKNKVGVLREVIRNMYR